MGDDFPLFVSAQNLKSVFQPIGAHLRPIVRIHLFLSNFVGTSPVIFNFLSILLHIFTSLSLYLVLKEYNKKISLFSSLFFFSLFAYNEAIFWISAIGIVYSLLFSLLSIYFFEREKYLFSLIFLVLSFFSYETWIVLLFYFILSRKKKILPITSSIILLVLHLLMAISSHDKILSYGGLPSFNEIPARIFYYFYKNFFPFSYISKSPLIYLASFVFFVFLFYLTFKTRENFLLPFLFYFVPASIFLLSRYIPSRFFYFPVLSVAIFLSYIIFEKKPWSLIVLPAIIYLSILSPIINYLDGIDYHQYSLMHKAIVNEGRRLMEEIQPGDKITLVNRLSLPLTEISANSVKGSPKIFLHRGKGIGGLIDLDVFVNFILKGKGLMNVPLTEEEGSKIIVIGKKNFVSKYSFKVEKINK